MQTLDTTTVKASIDKIIERLAEFANKKELTIVTNNIGLYYINIKDTLSHKVKFVNENLSSYIDDRKLLNDEVISFKKKMEGLAQKVQILKNSVGDPNISGKSAFIDTSKFLDMNAFAEYVKMKEKELEDINFRIEENKRKIDDNTTSLKEKITKSDLNAFEG